MRTNLAIFILAASLIGPAAALSEDTQPQTDVQPMTKGDADPGGDYASHYTFGPPVATYTTQGSNQGGQPASGTSGPGGETPDSAAKSTPGSPSAGMPSQ